MHQNEIAELKDDLKSLRQDITAVLSAANLAHANQANVELRQVLLATTSKATEYAIAIERLSGVQYAMQGLFQRIEESQETQRALTNVIGGFRTETAIHTAIDHAIPLVMSNVMTYQGDKLRQDYGSPDMTTQSNTNVGVESVTTASSIPERLGSVPRGIQGRSIRRQGFHARALEHVGQVCPTAGQLETLRFLYTSGLASVHDVDPFQGENALNFAVMNKYLNIARFLLDSGADADCENFVGWSPIHCVLDVVLRDSSPKSCEASAWLSLFDLDFEDSFGALPCLHRIILGLSTRKLEDELFEHPESIDDTDRFGRTALWWATREASNSHFKLLLAHGADINISDLNGDSPFNVSAFSGSTQNITLLHDLNAQMKPNFYGQWPIHQASKSVKSLETLKLLLHWWCDPNVQDVRNRTPLYWSCMTGADENAEVLLQYSANANILDESRDQLWQTAVANNSEKTLNVLLRHGSDLGSCTPGRRTVLHLVAQLALQPVVDVLKEADLTRVDADAVDEHGNTADDCLSGCRKRNHRGRPGCSADLHDSIQRLIKKVRAANHHIHEMPDTEELALEYESEDLEEDDSHECTISDDEESSYEDAQEAWEAKRSS
ncbi:hypothetical protein MMC17_002752 [Xylographa soralifera]|nr:hypothetical protein [Xylographa soralifera]